jgi:hypothetical protein
MCLCRLTRSIWTISVVQHLWLSIRVLYFYSLCNCVFWGTVYSLTSGKKPVDFHRGMILFFSLSLFLYPFRTLSPSILCPWNSCKIWSLTLRDGHKLRGIENKPLWPEAMKLKSGKFRIVQIEKLLNLCKSPSIVRMKKSRSYDVLEM